MKKVLFLGEEKEFSNLSKIVENLGYDAIKVDTFKDLYTSIPVQKPQLIFCPVDTKYGKISSKFPFVPILLYGEKEKKVKKMRCSLKPHSRRKKLYQ